MASLAMILSLTLPGLYTIQKRYANRVLNGYAIPIPPKCPIYEAKCAIKQVKHKWKYFDFDHYDMTRDADKRLYINWENRDKSVKWWKEQYNVQYGKII